MERALDIMGNCKVLVVDDEPTTRLMTSACLKREGFRVTEAESGEGALKSISAKKPGIVLLDVLMPGMDGFDVCSWIRSDEEKSGIPVLMMTGLNDEKSIRRAYEAGATDFITKPINWNLLGYRVRYILRSSMAHERMCEAEDRNSAIVHALPDLLLILDSRGTVLDVGCGQDSYDLYGDASGLTGSRLGDVLPLDISARALDCVSMAIRTGETQCYEYKLPFRGGDRHFEARVKSFKKDTVLALIRNITERKVYERRIAEYQHGLEDLVADRTAELTCTVDKLKSEVAERKRIADELTMLDMAAKTTNTGITVTNLNRSIVYINPADTRMHGYNIGELVNADVGLFSPPELISPLSVEEIERLGSWQRESVNMRKDGSRFPVKLVSDVVRDNEGKAIGMVTTCEDISDRKAAEKEIKEYQGRLEHLVQKRTEDLNSTVARLQKEVKTRKMLDDKIVHLAFHDELTGLPNRTFFSKNLWDVLKESGGTSVDVALMYIDLDNFKNINDTLGHSAGDYILCEVGKRLASVIRRDDSLLSTQSRAPQPIVSRLGGDEFIIMLTHIKNRTDIEKIAQRIIDRLSEPFNIDCHQIFITPSIGIAVCPEHGSDADTLMMNADTAMYSAKNDGKNNFKFYSSAMSENLMNRLVLENDLHKALEADDLMVYYQPQYDMVSNRIVCLEALARWNHRQHGIINPDTFIPLAEQHGLIVRLGNVVLNKVCKHISLLRDNSIDPVKVAVNVSGIQFSKTFPDTLAATLDGYGIPNDMIEVEITESCLMKDPQSSIKILNRLKALGLSLSIDDFGTGYSSLSYLKRFPVDALKIDRSFVGEILKNKENDTIITAIVAMAHSMNLKVIAEGIETEEQFNFLREQGCNYVQGYYYSMPLDISDTELLLRNLKQAA